MSDEEQAGYDLVMPFVTVASKGGPHEDQAYTAGWEMGALDAYLQYGNVQNPWQQTIRTDNAPQADRIAMKNGWIAEFDDDGNGWTGMTLRLDESETPRDR